MAEADAREQQASRNDTPQAAPCMAGYESFFPARSAR